MTWPFLKMHGLGNDFVVLDGREATLEVTPSRVRAIADRRLGVGCDQLVLLTPPTHGVDIGVSFHNADGGAVAACGNATRCVAALAMDERQAEAVTVGTPAGPVRCRRTEDGLVSADMGQPSLEWQAIPLSRQVDTLALPVVAEGLADPVAVNVGNPHMVFFVADAEAVELHRLGPLLEHHPLFPERTNVEVCHVDARDRLRMRVWERGAGITRACGTGACASAVAANRRNLCGRDVTVGLDGGDLTISLASDGHVWMTGPVATAFRGTLDPSILMLAEP